MNNQASQQSDVTVFERFERIAKARPQQVAYSDQARRVSYGELADRAVAVRANLAQVGPTDAGFVGILTSDRINALVAVLAVAASGHAYVLLDVNDPDKRLAHIIHEVGPFAILTDGPLFGRGAGLARDAAVIDLDRVKASPALGQKPGVPVSPDSLLYVSFTSGSTGVPKGVCQTHRNLMFYVDAYIDTMQIGAGDPISWLFAHGASASNMDIYGALFTGAQLCAFEIKDNSFAALADWIDATGIVLLHTVPTVVRELVGAIPADRCFNHVRVVDLAGEMLFANDVTRMRRHFPADCRILNRLAATEASFISSLVVTSEHEVAEGPLPVGTPPARVEISILRDDGSSADVGETGAIAIDSPHICTGYLNRPELNAATFPVLEDRPSWRRYRSADLGFIDAEGQLNFIGRSGSRIKLRGLAVDLAEIESALLQCEGVTGAVVLPRSEEGEEAREILAYLTLGPDLPQEAAHIRKQLAESLPTYMLPSGYIFLEKFPYTATSKVDRKALAALDLATVRFRPGYMPPENEMEERVAAIFSEVLNLAPVGRLDDFFLLGGDSLALVNLQILATETFGRQFTDLHEDASVMGIAARLGRSVSQSGIDAPIILPIRTQGSSPALFVVHGRRGQAHVGPHFLDLLGTEQPLYAIQARGLDGKSEPHNSIEAMAAEYVDAIREVQREGPYFLGGFCAGSYVTLEMIRLLLRQGEKYIAPLIIDPPRPNFKGGGDEIPEELLLWQLERRVRSGEWKVDLENADAVGAAIKVARAFESALQAYEPKIIPVASSIIATKKRWGREEKVRQVFGPRARIFLVEGGHGDILSPDNEQFAAAVKQSIANVARNARLYRAKLKTPA